MKKGIGYPLQYSCLEAIASHYSFPGGSDGKRICFSAGDWVRSLGWKDPVEMEIAPYSSILAWRIPWTEETGGVQSMGLQRAGHDSVINTFTLITLKSGWAYFNCLPVRAEEE